MNTVLSLQDPEAARRYYEAGHWRPETMYMVLRRHALASPDKFALRDSVDRLTYGEVLAWVDALAEDLRGAGVRPGQRLSVWLPSRAESVIILLACSRMGYVANTSLHFDYTCDDVVALVERARSAALFAEPGYGTDAECNNIFEVAASHKGLRKVYRLEPLETRAGQGDEAPRFGGLRPAMGSSLPFATNPDRIVYLAFTSGTTGLPKGVMHSDNTLLANGRAIAKDWRLDDSSVLYTLSPMSHNMGTVALVTTLAAGGELVVHGPMDARRALDRIIETGATYGVGVPTHAIDLIAEARARGIATLGSVTGFQLSGAPIPGEVVEALLEMGVTPQNTFGMTENCSFQYTRPDDDAATIINTCGRSSDGFEIKIFDQVTPDAEVAPGEVGEMGARGASLMLGYYDDQAVTEDAFNRGGWFMTGDLARIDDNGNAQIAGRKKDLIIRGGHNIYPARIEDLTLRHPSVAKAAAFPVADDRLGEKVCLAVIPRATEDVDAQDILNHLDSRGLSKYDMPEYFLSVETFPLTASGKILKRRLVEMVATGALRPKPVRWRPTT
ncbi:MAG: class I adenylate-forming enzyme family protein [Rhodospirillales bacterium]|jgi:acyl-CoA synthetase|nr:class I adenylate-forming enzyme family protein [Rhodospirillales bacterium]MDP6774384.1 class I adenylate-forming enzyme family protein [Rhodospirillales bacterium]